jgi:hypothetical protein
VKNKPRKRGPRWDTISETVPHIAAVPAPEQINAVIISSIRDVITPLRGQGEGHDNRTPREAVDFVADSWFSRQLTLETGTHLPSPPTPPGFQSRSHWAASGREMDLHL